MKKVILLALIAIAGVATANAQFTKGSKTLFAKSTGLDFGITSIDGVDDSRISLDLSVGGSYFVIDNLAITAGVGIQSQSFGDENETAFDFTIGAKYYFYKGLYAGLAYEGAKFEKLDLQSAGKIEVGYDWYLTDNVYFEPAVYFQKGFGDIDGISQFGLSIGIGVNF
jgi:opacity protein-like surface antigen